MPGELVAPTTDLYHAWRAVHQEWGPGRHEDGFGLRPDDDVDTPHGFAAWIVRLREASDPLTAPASGQVRTTSWWIVEDGHSLVLSTYGHLMPDSEDRTPRAIDNAWSACAPSSVPYEEAAGP